VCSRLGKREPARYELASQPLELNCADASGIGLQCVADRSAIEHDLDLFAGTHDSSIECHPAREGLAQRRWTPSSLQKPICRSHFRAEGCVNDLGKRVLSGAP
jgi:hypothetical protein